MEDKSNLPKLFDSVYHDIDPPVDYHVNLTPGQPPTLAVPETRPGNGEDPASPELPRPEVANDSESPPDVRDPPTIDPPLDDHGQHMEYQVVSAGRQTTTLTDCPPSSSATKAASVRRPGTGARRTGQTERRDTFLRSKCCVIV